MTQTKFVFSYTETRDFEEPLEITMEVPERSIDEMCEYFQRFLAAAGYLFENNESIRCVADKIKLPNEDDLRGYTGCAGDELTFSNGKPLIYDFDSQTQVPWDFGGDTQIPCDFGVRGGMAEDIIKL